MRSVALCAAALMLVMPGGVEALSRDSAQLLDPPADEAYPAAPSKLAGDSPASEDDDLLLAVLAGRSRLGADENARIAQEASAYPLGNRENPIRAHMPEGQRAYLQRLRCNNGRAPSFHRTGNLGMGIYGNIIDNYEVVCPGSGGGRHMLIMDMYHPDHIETAAPPGFNIVAP